LHEAVDGLESCGFDLTHLGLVLHLDMLPECGLICQCLVYPPQWHCRDRRFDPAWPPVTIEAYGLDSDSTASRRCFGAKCA
jgi:hypothetical protein